MISGVLWDSDVVSSSALAAIINLKSKKFLAREYKACGLSTSGWCVAVGFVLWKNEKSTRTEKEKNFGHY